MEPHKDILQSELRKAEQAEPIAQIAPLLGEIVARGSWILRESFERFDGKLSNLALPLICHNQLENLDALAALCREAICLPANLLLRAIHEAHFMSRFIDMDEAKFSNRSLSYLYEYHRQYFKAGRKIFAARGEDAKWVDEALAKLRTGHFKKVLEEDDRLREYLKECPHHSRPYQWYSLFGGPLTMADLVSEVLGYIPPKELGGAESNNLMYADYSQTMHANDLYRRMFSENGKTKMRSFRTFNKPSDFVTPYRTAAVMTTFSLCLMAIRHCGNGKSQAAELWKFIEPELHKLEKFQPSGD